MMWIREKAISLVSGLILSISVFLLLLLGMEVILRALKIQSDNFIMQDPVLGWTHLPNKEGYSISEEFTVKRRINKNGFIGRDYDYIKPQGVYRIIIAGDSLTEAFQIEEVDTFASLTELKLSSLADRKIEVLNMSMAGIGTQKETYILENKGLKFDPDLLVLAFFIGNDFYNNITEKVNMGAEFSKSRKLENSIKLFLRNHSSVWRFVLKYKSQNKLFNLFNNQDNVPKTSNSPGDPLFKDEYSEETINIVSRTKEYILDFKNLADREGLDHLVLLLPSASQVYFDQNEDFNPKKINDILEEYFLAEGIEYLDVLPDFRSFYKLNPEVPLYFPIDGHINEQAHLLIADRIHQYLMKNLSTE